MGFDMKKGLIFLIFLVVFLASGNSFGQDKEPPKGEIAADSNQYIIGAEDVLHIYVWREDTVTKTVTVRADGKISIPLVDDIQAAGITPLALKEKITGKLKEFFENPTVSVIVIEANSCKVYISGQIRTPGVIRLRSETTIAQLISMAGGLTEWANPKKILILRKEGGVEKKIVINYKKIMQGEDLSSNMVLKAGDTIIVP